MALVSDLKCSIELSFKTNFGFLFGCAAINAAADWSAAATAAIVLNDDAVLAVIDS